MTASSQSEDTAIQNPFWQRLAIAIYGIGAYTIAMLSIVWLMGASGGFLPLGFEPLSQSLIVSILINVILVIVFGLQHSIMARVGFKQWWTSKIPAAAERSTYVLASGLALVLLLCFWQPMPQVIWSVESSTLQTIIWTVFAFGWIYLVLATFAIDHFDLFGLRQVYYFWRSQPYPELPFMKRWMYTFNRHPIQTGILLGIWATPEMRLDHLFLSITFTVYVFVGLAFEERDLIQRFGEQYRQYAAQVGGVIPGRRSP